jgi:hypothetical protein
MFWSRRKTNVLKDTHSLQSLATQLGVERRLNVRVDYPQTPKICRLPEIYFQDNLLKVQNISVGGCCVLDPLEHLGPTIGHELELNLHWATTAERVKARIVSRVDHRRHMQFLDLTVGRRNQLVKSMAYGVRGQSLTRSAHASELGPSMDALELWSSPHRDSVILLKDMHRTAQIFFQNEEFVIYREAWPSKAPGGKCSRPEYEQLILFLANIPLPSPALRELLGFLESQLKLEQP